MMSGMPLSSARASRCSISASVNTLPVGLVGLDTQRAPISSPISSASIDVKPFAKAPNGLFPFLKTSKDKEVDSGVEQFIKLDNENIKNIKQLKDELILRIYDTIISLSLPMPMLMECTFECCC